MTENTAALNASHTRQVALCAAAQIQRGVLMSLGATDMGNTIIEEMPALVFIARILPFNKDGRRSSRPAKMAVHVALDGSDTYTVIVQRLHQGERVEHARAEGIYFDQLNHVLLALDYDGEDAFNPRYWATK